MGKYVSVCASCRMPLIVGCFGLYCCEVCRKWACEARPIRLAVPSELLHGTDCRERLAELLAHRASFAHEE